MKLNHPPPDSSDCGIDLFPLQIKNNTQIDIVRHRSDATCLIDVDSRSRTLDRQLLEFQYYQCSVFWALYMINTHHDINILRSYIYRHVLIRCSSRYIDEALFIVLECVSRVNKYMHSIKAVIAQMVRAFGMNPKVGGSSPPSVETFSVSKTLTLSQEHRFVCRKWMLLPAHETATKLYIHRDF